MLVGAADSTGRLGRDGSGRRRPGERAEEQASGSAAEGGGEQAVAGAVAGGRSVRERRSLC